MSIAQPDLYTISLRYCDLKNPYVLAQTAICGKSDYERLQR